MIENRFYCLLCGVIRQRLLISSDAASNLTCCCFLLKNGIFCPLKEIQAVLRSVDVAPPQQKKDCLCVSKCTHVHTERSVVPSNTDMDRPKIRLSLTHLIFNSSAFLLLSAWRGLISWFWHSCDTEPSRGINSARTLLLHGGRNEGVRKKSSVDGSNGLFLERKLQKYVNFWSLLWQPTSYIL